MAKWTKAKIIDDNWSIQECFDELYDFDEMRVNELEIYIKKNDFNLKQLNEASAKIITKLKLKLNILTLVILLNLGISGYLFYIYK